MQTVAQGNEFHLVDNLVDEGKLQQQLGLLDRNAALLHIEQCRIVQLPHSGTMGTLHVVGIYFQHRLGVHAGGLRGREVLIRHLR